jgi:hypothetical protein
MSKLPQRLAAGLLCVLFAVAIYRAGTQSFTIDEAFVFRLYVNEPLAAMASSYDACNHVLHTLLMKFFRYWLGTSELVLRLASLLGCLAYFTAVYRLVGLSGLGGWVQLFTVALLTANPLVLDFMVAARGYGLALGLLMWAFYYASRWVLERRDRDLARAGITAGLAIAANLTVLPAVAALGVILLILAAQAGIRGIWSITDRFAGPAVIIAFLFLVLPLAKATGEEYYYGAKTLRDSVGSLLDASLLHTPERSLLTKMGTAGTAIPGWLRRYAVPAAFGIAVIGAVFILPRAFEGREVRPVALVFGIIGGTLGLTVAALEVMHWRGLLYPLGRTGLYLVPLFTLTCVLGAALLHRAGRYVVYLGLAVILGVYVSQFNTSHFSEWRFDASTNEIVRRLSEDYKRSGDSTSIRVGSSWVYGETLKYYCKRRRLNWVEAVDSQKLREKPFDYYVLVYEDIELVDKLQLAVIYRDPLSGAVLARGS